VKNEMAVSVKDVEKIADLARLKMDTDEKEKMTGQLNMILEYMEKLNELNTRGVEPLAHTQELVNVFREDEVKPSLPVEKALENAPDRMGNYFKVPKVIVR
jgi:aspartyl-tRNA(Asn)/glutamyl-tRNA(Gln) amidotransferase subunit C